MGKEPLGFAIPSQAEGLHRNGSDRSWVDPTAPRCCCTPEPFPALAVIGCHGHLGGARHSPGSPCTGCSDRECCSSSRWLLTATEELSLSPGPSTECCSRQNG